jgi:hypothetical protein
VNFNQIVLEALKNEWVLFVKHKVPDDDDKDVETTLHLKPANYLTAEEKLAIKKEMRPNEHYKKAYTGYSVLGYEELTVIFGSREYLNDEKEYLKNSYKSVGAKVKDEMFLEPELRPHWGGLVDEL